MIISDTSALVLNWTSKDIWKSNTALDYFAGLDLSAGDELLKQFDTREHFMHTQAVSNRKFFMRKKAIEFLDKNPDGQVLIFGAGIAPLSVEIASLYHDCVVFDIDKHLMIEKKEYLSNACPNIHFVSCDITDIPKLKSELAENGWDQNEPSILILEGIIYYLSETDLRNTLREFSNENTQLACDFGLKYEYINESNRNISIDLFRKIKDWTDIPMVNLYEPTFFISLLKDCGFQNPIRYSLADVQLERVGEKSPFEGEETGWISLVED